MKKLKGKFVVAYDTICEGTQCIKEEDGSPRLYNSSDDALKEIFDDALSMLENRSKAELKEYNLNITTTIVKEMQKINDAGNVELMKAFLEKYPNANDNGEWVEKADDFLENRKAIYTSEGLKINGKKINDKY